MIRILHTSDWQIGKVFRSFDSHAGSLLHRERLEAIRRLGRLAAENNATAVLVAGDVWDSSQVSDQTLSAPLERMRQFPGLEWHLIPGNHDPHASGGPWARLLERGLPPNVRVHAEPKAAPIGDGRQAWLLPAPLTRRHAFGDPTEPMDGMDVPGGVIRVGLAHGSIQDFGSERSGSHNRIATDRVVRSRLNYLASRTSSKDIELRREQLEKLLADHRQVANGLKVEIGRLEASLTERQGAGIDESIDRIENELEELRNEQKKGEARLNALLLLKKELLAAQLRAKQRYLEPVMGRIEPYLQVLFPGARVKCTEELALETVERSGKQEPLEMLSNGTREQIAVLTRLAFADLLLDSGRPAAVILDDSLAFSDATRLDLMFDVLTEAAKKIQITIFSSRDRAFDRLGGNRLAAVPLS